MKPVFADSWYYLALLIEDDAGHEKASQWSGESTRDILLTDFILVEVGNVLTRGAARRRFLELVQSLRTDADTVIIPASRELVEEGLRLFGQRADKEWSLTDCISFLVMRQRGITEALTGDHHFEQAGFTILLK
ncbi:MAG TPA: PIN domain-containing protein [Planctomycetota bacterium]|nr:PIN domain-containing protein [Planctomycetota bacterium]